MRRASCLDALTSWLIRTPYIVEAITFVVLRSASQLLPSLSSCTSSPQSSFSNCALTKTGKPKKFNGWLQRIATRVILREREPILKKSLTMRSLPNIIVTGTPGVGKTTMCNEILGLASQASPPLNLKHLSINDIVKERSCHTGYDEELQTLIVDEDMLMDEVEKEIADGEGEGGWVIDWHSTAGFAVRWVDLVVVLRCEETNVLFDRLSSRGYKDEKVQENMDAEIFGVVSEEAKEAWDEEGQVVELRSVAAEDVFAVA